MNQNAMWKPALIGGVLLGILSAVPPVNLFNCVCCAWVIGGGILAAHLYVKNSPTPVKLGSGVLLGLLTGAIGGVVYTLFSIPIRILLSKFGMGMAEEVQQVLSNLNLPPETRDLVTSMMANTGSLHIVFTLIAGLVNIIIYAVIAMLGGVLGVAIFEKRKVDTPPPTYQPPIHLPPPPPPPTDQP